MRKLLSISSLLAFIIVSAQNFVANSITAELKEGAYAVIRNEKKTIDIHSINKVIHTNELIITVFDKSGDKFAQPHEFYDPNTKITTLEAVYYDQNGIAIKKFKSKDFLDQSYISDGQMYTDSRIKYLNYSSAQYPYTLHFKSVINYSNTTIGRWTPVSSYNVAIEKSSYTINNLMNLKMNSKEMNLSDFGISNQNPNQSVVHYEMKNQKAFDKEDMTLQFKNIFPNVEFSAVDFIIDGVKGNFTDWNGMGKWYRGLLTNSNDFTPTQKKFYQDLVKDAKNDKQKVSILYKYLQNKTRYIGVQLGIGGLQPFPASYVESKSYGDCKALTNYMQSMLDAVGIKSYYTVVYGGSKIDFHTDFASVAQGNHVILYVPLNEEDLWLETTSQQTAFNYLGTFTDNRNALIVTPEGGKIIKTQSFPAEKNTLNIFGSIEIFNDGKLKGDYKMDYAGLQYEQIYRVNFQSSKDQKRILQDIFETLPNLNILNYKFENNWDEAIFTANVNLESTQFGKIHGNNMVINILPSEISTTSLKKNNNRKYPFEIRHGYVDEAEFEIKIPKDYKLDGVFEPIAYQTEFGNYQLTVNTAEGNSLKVKRIISIKDGIYPKEKFNDYVEFQRKISSFDNSKILLEKL
ncbi:DUF3857 domain-containing protein [Moheibacter sediminis]|uniref:DUF3857 domain-containing protein n=1 Tax=Moheibacter sediminis TaxID=1434700 RepID=A0A1W2CU56_9FLAO|nr:DUF3857 domain-containing protein [Moheibacter sediminis]SMC88761.1 protein of unknown function [Moheibacter sediminis]